MGLWQSYCSVQFSLAEVASNFLGPFLQITTWCGFILNYLYFAISALYFCYLKMFSSLMTKYASNNRLNRSNVNAAGMSPKTRK